MTKCPACGKCNHLVIGDKFVLSDDAEENYEDLLIDLFGDHWKNRTYKVVAVAHDRSEHLGYDEGANSPDNRQMLYDFKDVMTGRTMPISIYDWEID